MKTNQIFHSPDTSRDQNSRNLDLYQPHHRTEWDQFGSIMPEVRQRHRGCAFGGYRFLTTAELRQLVQQMIDLDHSLRHTVGLTPQERLQRADRADTLRLLLRYEVAQQIRAAGSRRRYIYDEERALGIDIVRDLAFIILVQNYALCLAAKDHHDEYLTLDYSIQKAYDDLCENTRAYQAQAKRRQEAEEADRQLGIEF